MHFFFITGTCMYMYVYIFSRFFKIGDKRTQWAT